LARITFCSVAIPRSIVEIFANHFPIAKNNIAWFLYDQQINDNGKMMGI